MDGDVPLVGSIDAKDDHLPVSADNHRQRERERQARLGPSCVRAERGGGQAERTSGLAVGVVWCGVVCACVCGGLVLCRARAHRALPFFYPFPPSLSFIG